MKVEIKCPSCGRLRAVDREFIGQDVICDDPACGCEFVAELVATAKQVTAPAKPFTTEEMKLARKNRFWRLNARWIGLLTLGLGVAMWITIIAPALRIKPVGSKSTPGSHDDPVQRKANH